MKEKFKECIEYIDRVIDDGGRVVVHCMAGVSWSATVIIAYLMTKNKCSFKEAFDYTRSKRMVINPNPGFAK